MKMKFSSILILIYKRGCIYPWVLNVKNEKPLMDLFKLKLSKLLLSKLLLSIITQLIFLLTNYYLINLTKFNKLKINKFLFMFKDF